MSKKSRLMSVGLGCLLVWTLGAGCPPRVDVTGVVPTPEVVMLAENPDTLQGLPTTPNESGTLVVTVAAGELVRFEATMSDGSALPPASGFHWQVSNAELTSEHGPAFIFTFTEAGEFEVRLVQIDVWAATNPLVISQSRSYLRVLVQPATDPNPLAVVGDPQLNGATGTTVTIDEGSSLSFDLSGCLRGGQPPFSFLILTADERVLYFVNAVSDLHFNWSPSVAGVYRLRVVPAVGRSVDITFTVSFTPPSPPPVYFQLLLVTSGQGTIGADPAPATQGYVAGTTVYLLAAPATGWQFDGWGGDATGQSSRTTMVMDDNKVARAIFSRQTEPPVPPAPTVDLKVNGSDALASIVAPATLTLSWGSSDATMVTASGAWSGGKALSGVETITNLVAGEYTYTLAATGPGGTTTDQVVVTVTEPPPAPTYDLSINLLGEGFGAVTVDPNRAHYQAGETVTLTANPEVCCWFGYWGEDTWTSGVNPVTVTMDRDRTISCYFYPFVYTVTATAGAGGSVDPAGDSFVAYGHDQTINIYPNSGYQIDQVWVDGESVGVVSSWTFSGVTENHTLVASFRPVTPPAMEITSIALSAPPDGHDYHVGDEITFWIHVNRDGPVHYLLSTDTVVGVVMATNGMATLTVDHWPMPVDPVGHPEQSPCLFWPEDRGYDPAIRTVLLLVLP